MSNDRFKRVADIINDKVPLVDFLSRGLGYSLSDNDLPKSVSCPLHKDEKPSLRLYYPKERGGFCFSCGRSLTSLYTHKFLSGDSFNECVKYFLNNFSDYVSLEDIESREHRDSRSYKGLGDFNKKSKESELLASALSECFDSIHSMDLDTRRRAFNECDKSVGEFAGHLKSNDKSGAVSVLRSLVLSFRDNNFN